MADGAAGEAKLARGALGEEVAGETKGGSGFGGDGGEGEEAAEGEEAGGLVEADAGAEPAGGGAKDTAAGGGGEGAEAFDLESEALFAGAGGDGAAAAAGGLAGEQDLGEDAGKLGLPVGFLVACELGEVGEGPVERGIEGAELREELMAEAVAGEGGVGVGGVFAPGLVEGAEEIFDLLATDGEEGAEDAGGGTAGDGDGEDGVDASEAFGPGSTKELEEDGLGLVVCRVGGEDGVGVAGAEEVVEG